MQIDRTAREFANFTVSAADGDLELSVTDGATWSPLTSTENGTVYRALVAGPDAVGNPEGTIVLHLGTNPVSVRLVATPEVVVRGAGTIFVE